MDGLLHGKFIQIIIKNTLDHRVKAFAGGVKADTTRARAALNEMQAARGCILPAI